MSKKLFVGGDLSGIQSFLYNISSKKAALSLRGRSRYINDYMNEVYEELIIRVINERRIYNSGGKFYFITDDNSDNRRIIKDFALEKNRELWQEHFGGLSINIAFVTFEQTSKDGNREEISKCFRQITQKFASLKQKKFQNLFMNDYDKFFEVQQVSENAKVCDITGIESEGLVSVEDLKVLPSVKKQIEKGIELKNKNHLYMDFSDYCKNSYLGVLRMDVDGLGKRFANGFDNWEEYSNFSNHLTEFFDRENLTNKDYFSKEYIDIIYSGGDDIFAVGRWDKLIDFAYNIHLDVEKEFKEENIHISGGIAIVNPKFPISKAAELSGKAEEKSKSYSNAGKEKNAFTMFDETLSWTEEFDIVKEYKDKFLNLIEKHSMSKSILHKIMYYYEIIKENNINRKEDFSYLWHSAYYLTRFMDRYDKNEEVKQFVKALRDNILTKKENFKLLAIASRWAELILKDKEKQNNNK